MSEEQKPQIPEEVAAQAAAAVAEPNKIQELEAENAKLKDAMLRAVADAENVRRRAAKEVEDANKYGVSTFAKDLLSVAENLARALETLPEGQKDGVELTLKELLSIFERRGIKRIEPKPGEKFDHNFHQAMAQVEDPKFEAGAVISCLQAGYVLHDRLLRPAMVCVAKAQPQQSHKLDATA
jgi:molecular chaperone GrpE